MAAMEDTAMGSWTGPITEEVARTTLGSEATGEDLIMGLMGKGVDLEEVEKDLEVKENLLAGDFWVEDLMDFGEREDLAVGEVLEEEVFLENLVVEEVPLEDIVEGEVRLEDLVEGEVHLEDLVVGKKVLVGEVVLVAEEGLVMVEGLAAAKDLVVEGV